MYFMAIFAFLSVARLWRARIGGFVLFFFVCLFLLLRVAFRNKWYFDVTKPSHEKGLPFHEEAALLWTFAR